MALDVGDQIEHPLRGVMNPPLAGNPRHLLALSRRTALPAACSLAKSSPA
jgi:hypothetical protein